MNLCCPCQDFTEIELELQNYAQDFYGPVPISLLHHEHSIFSIFGRTLKIRIQNTEKDIFKSAQFLAANKTEPSPFIHLQKVSDSGIFRFSDYDQHQLIWLPINFHRTTKKSDNLLCSFLMLRHLNSILIALRTYTKNYQNETIKLEITIAFWSSFRGLQKLRIRISDLKNRKFNVTIYINDIFSVRPSTQFYTYNEWYAFFENWVSNRDVIYL